MEQSQQHAHEKPSVFKFSDIDKSKAGRKPSRAFQSGETTSAANDHVSEKKPVEFKSFSGKVWRIKPVAESVHQGLLELDMESDLANVFARRIDDLDVVLSIMSPKLADLDAPWTLPDIYTGLDALANAVENNKRIGLVCDFDADGMNSAAVLVSSLTDYFHVSAERIDTYIGQRLTEGYGLSDKLVDRILASESVPDIIITADCGSSDELRIARLKTHGIDVIVTDHHGLPVEGHPQSAVACISPLRDDSEYPDAKIAGCMVAWLFMSALRYKFVETGRLPESAPSLKLLLDFVALATVADCVSLGDSKNNRAVVNYGLQLINKDSRPCWRAFRDFIGGSDAQITSETLAFAIAPRLNARGRLSDATTGVDFLLSDSDIIASGFAKLLDDENKSRKEVEKGMCLIAIDRSLEQVRQYVDGVVVYLEDGHPGVHGIVASRVTERTGKPSIMLSPMVGNAIENGDILLSGSCRSVDGVDVRAALQYVADKKPGIFVKFGGHHGAAGLTTHLSELDDLRKLFDEAVKLQAGSSELLPVIETDGPLDPKSISLDFVDNISRAAPFGRCFMYPVYEGEFRIKSMRPVGEDKTHLSLVLSDGKVHIKAIWFNVRETKADPLPVVEGGNYRFAYAVTENVYNGSSTVQLMVSDVMDAGLR